MTDTPRPTLVTNPSADRPFRDAAERDVERARSAAELQELLRRSYPRAVVRPREISGEATVVWYVYREGHWVANDGS